MKPTSNYSSTALEIRRRPRHPPVVNPVTGEGMADLPLATDADLEEALAASRALAEWRATDVEKRAAILHKAADLMRERAEHIGRP